ncbi:hypothetical protein GUJ93_ZPchr0002g26488 [Zizania palustris]|uniref:Uncharacterized protein n=1 Tax=Zizania palustris TaxID=103762 RepID=A0A8J5RZR9_ZIZPA|nr:hypothetical protein GUJ93_ZPchr0002g26488 [Zizania palustris]
MTAVPYCPNPAPPPIRPLAQRPSSRSRHASRRRSTAGPWASARGARRRRRWCSRSRPPRLSGSQPLRRAEAAPSEQRRAGRTAAAPTTQQQPVAAPAAPSSGKRWSFGKSSWDSAEAAAAAVAAVAKARGSAAIARLAEAAWLRSMYAEMEREREQSKHVIAVTAATAAAADAAAQAAVAVVRLTSKGRVAPVLAVAGDLRSLGAAAVRIQTAFRGFLVRSKGSTHHRISVLLLCFI